MPHRITRAAQVFGLLGGVAWVVTAFLWEGGDDPLELGLFWAGAALITLFLLELGTLLVKRGLLALRLFVAWEDTFFSERLGRHGVSVIMPAEEHHDWLNSAIYDELVHGRVVDATRRRVVALTEELWDAGARAILLGCTEIELLVSQADVELPVLPCTTLHVNAALDRALA